MSTKMAVWFGAAILLCILQVSLATFACNETSHLRVGAFNLKRFGKTKWSDEERRVVLTQIVLQYDILLLTEIQDKYLTYVTQWWQRVNQTRAYGMVISLPLGRSDFMKFQTGVFYRDDKVRWLGNFTFNDTGDFFYREPLCIRFAKNGTGSDWEFVVIGVHIKYDQAVTELYNMTSVYDAVQGEWPSVKDIVFMGDLNAAGTYVNEQEIANLPYAHGKIFNDMMAHWLINSSVDTTVSVNNNFTYDRIIVSGPNMPVAVVPNTAGAWRFNETFGLDDTQTGKISDHFPVEYCMYWWNIF